MLLLTAVGSSLIAFGQIPQGEEEIPPSQLSPPSDPNSAKVIISSSVGGTTTPTSGTHEYPNGTVITLTAIPQAGFKFVNWVIEGGYTSANNLPPIYLPADFDATLAPPRPAAAVSAGDRLVLSDNPLRVLCGYGWSFKYQAVFAPETTFTRSANAIVNILTSVGGTTNPSAGSYSFENGTSYVLAATPASGYEFKYWVVSGSYLPGHGVSDQPTLDDTVITDNPLDVSCGYGYEYTYQPLFTPVGAQIPDGGQTDGGTTDTSGISMETFYIVVIALVVIIVVAVAFAVYSMRKSKR
ncbi:MAG: hypothetical protein WC325_03690 [Candidatus Bathyarchaeia archaeon]|jgi:hypothetical protein